MDLLQIAVLALLQGLTEFLPVSSSAHLILVPVLTAWDDQGMAFDIAVHVGTLAAVVFYFRRELAAMAHDWGSSLLRRQSTPQSRLAWAVIVGTVPVGLAGLAGKSVIETQLRSPLVIAATTLMFGLLLGYAWKRGLRRRDEYAITWPDVLVIGCAQALALVPGTSRSGITITAGLLRGLSGQAAARFSFLLSIPVIVLAGALQAVELFETAGPVDWRALIAGTLISGVSAYLCIHYFLRLLESVGMMPFVIYRLLLGALLLVVFI